MKRTKPPTAQHSIMTDIEIDELYKELDKLMTKCIELIPSDRKQTIMDSLIRASKELNMLRVETITKTNDDGNIE